MTRPKLLTRKAAAEQFELTQDTRAKDMSGRIMQLPAGMTGTKDYRPLNQDANRGLEAPTGMVWLNTGITSYLVREDFLRPVSKQASSKVAEDTGWTEINGEPMNADNATFYQIHPDGTVKVVDVERTGKNGWVVRKGTTSEEEWEAAGGMWSSEFMDATNGWVDCNSRYAVDGILSKLGILPNDEPGGSIEDDLADLAKGPKMGALPSTEKPRPLSLNTRWTDGKGREWQIIEKLPAGRNICTTTDRRFQGEWTTKEIRDALGASKTGASAKTADDADTIARHLESYLQKVVKQALDDLESHWDLYGGKVEVVESQSRDGFIAYTNGGVQGSTILYWDQVMSAGNDYRAFPDSVQASAKKSEDTLYEFALDHLKQGGEDADEWAQTTGKDLNTMATWNDVMNAVSEAEDAGAENADTLRNKLYDDYERAAFDGEGIRLDITVMLYNPNNQRGDFADRQPGQWSCAVTGGYNFESPYFRDKYQGKGDYQEHEFAFDGMNAKDFNTKFRAALNALTTWMKS